MGFEKSVPKMCKNVATCSLKKNFMYTLLGQKFFFSPSKHSIGIPVMDFERIFHVPFFFHLILPKRAV